MKLNRLLEITTLLLNKKSVTAAELAERFGVSVRTIYRDIDVLSSSGVPVCTTQGVNGGISIMENFSVSTAMLSEPEKESVLLALQTLSSTKYPEVDTVLQKLGSIFKSSASDWISVDFSPWGSNPNAYHKFTDIKNAILQQKVIEIDYINVQNKRTQRKIEPLRLIFKYQAWYLWGYCLKRQAYRTFRISRIKNVVVTDTHFDKNVSHDKPTNDHANEYGSKSIVHLILQFTEQALYRLYDDYDDDCIHDNGDGTYTLEFDFPEDDWVYGYILSFGTNVKVISPLHIREIIREKSKIIAKFYE